FNLSRISGLAAVFKQQRPNHYLIEVSSGKFSRIIKSNSLKSELPKLEAEWGDRTVKLKWSTEKFGDRYFGYIIDKSGDGLNYYMKDSLPYVNFSNKKNSHEIIEKTDSLAQNDKVYYFRLRGMDYFGDYTKIHSSITGFGSKQLDMSPFFVYADQTENNQAHLKWDIHESQIEILKDFTIFRTDTIGG